MDGVIIDSEPIHHQMEFEMYEELGLNISREEHKNYVGTSSIDMWNIERLFEATKGNPFFTKELVHALLDAGTIIRDDTGAWSISSGRDISSEALPATIQQAVVKIWGTAKMRMLDRRVYFLFIFGQHVKV